MPDAHKVVWTWTLDGVPHAQNVTYVTDIGGFSPLTQSKANEIGDAITAATTGSPNSWRQHIANDWSFSVTAQSVDQPNRVEFDTGAARGGQGPNDALPRMISLCVRLNTASTFNGRMFIPGYAEAASGALGPPNGSAVADTLTIFNDLRALYASVADMDWVVYSRTLDAIAPVIGVVRSQSSSVTGWQRQARRARPLR